MDEKNRKQRTKLVKELAGGLGFDCCGISKAESLTEEAVRLREWLSAGNQGEMAYMNNHFEKRIDPRELLPGSKSIVSLLHNYYSAVEPDDPRAPQVAKYAYGKDYHRVIRKKLKALLAELRSEIGEVNGRGFVDSAPVAERSWAARAGLGWIGKNGMLINRESGSYFFIAELLLDIELKYDSPVPDLCADCRICIDACPTGAIVEPQVVDARRCISYLTIEYKGEIPAPLARKMGRQVFGCDICQDVCPFNIKTRQHREPRFDMTVELKKLRKEEWRAMDEAMFERVFSGSAVKRAGFAGMRRNIERFFSGRKVK